MEEAGWAITYCLDEAGFPRVLYEATSRLGIMEHPEYVGREYHEYGTDRCEVTIHVGASERYRDTRPWSVSTIGFRFADTYQAVARKALRYLCQMYERPIRTTAMRFFPPLDRNRPTWMARMRTIEGASMREDSPTVVAMTGYLLALDELYDEHAAALRRCIRRAEEAETREGALRTKLAEARAKEAEAESRAVAAAEALKAAQDRYTRLLNEAYAATQAHKRNIGISEEQMVLEGIPICSAGSFKRKFCATTSAPPPTPADKDPEDAEEEEEEPLMLTQYAAADNDDDEYTPSTPKDP